jgi:sec-independent protein translocase protein TatC
MASNDTLPDGRMSFTEHLEELRRRLIISLIAVGVGFVVSYSFADRLFALLVRPLIKVMPPGEKLVFTALPEAFFTYFKVALIAGVAFASPVIIYQVWCFVAPGLYERERRLLLPVVLSSTLFFLGGALFGYFVVFPFGFKFFISFAGDHVRVMPTLKESLGFATWLLLVFGIVFETPLVILILARLGIVNAAKLRRNQKYAVLIIFIVAAILTPPDLVSQLLMAVPLLILYEMGIWIAKLFGKKPTAQSEGPVTESAS